VSKLWVFCLKFPQIVRFSPMFMLPKKTIMENLRENVLTRANIRIFQVFSLFYPNTALCVESLRRLYI
jgi:hypothetical protein